MKIICLCIAFLGMFLGFSGKGGTAYAAGRPAEEKSGQLREEQTLRAEYRKISAEDALRFMQETEGFILLDVRTEEEYRETRIPGSRLLPQNEITQRAGSELPDKNSPILVYCRTGGRSERAARELVNMGYTQVYDMGGILNWPYETEGD